MSRASRQRRSGIRWSKIMLPSILVSGTALAGLGAKAFYDRPVRNLHLEGSFERVTPVEVQAALAPALSRKFLTLNLLELRTQVEAMAWVKTAQVSRQWPDSLAIRVVEQKAAARWGDTEFLNFDGEVFAGNARHAFPELPRLAGPPNTERQVVQRYLELRGPLGAANLTLAALTIDERGSWSMELQGGQTIRVGRRDVEQRLDRFFRLAAPLLSGEFDRVSHVDLRYANGFSVGWRPAPTSGSAAAAGGE